MKINANTTWAVQGQYVLLFTKWSGFACS